MEAFSVTTIATGVVALSEEGEFQNDDKEQQEYHSVRIAAGRADIYVSIKKESEHKKFWAEGTVVKVRGRIMGDWAKKRMKMTDVEILAHWDHGTQKFVEVWKKPQEAAPASKK